MQRTLQKKDQTQLSKWIGSRKDFQLLYRASRDGCSNTAFHQKCDNKGPTVTVFYNTSDCVFGGYTAVSWDSSSGHKADPTAFLFRLYYKASWSPKKYPTINGNHAINSNGNLGPCFGSGPDINSFSGTLAHNGTYFPLNGGLSLGNSFDMKGDNSNTAMCSTLTCYDIEVYSIEVPKELWELWRPVVQDCKTLLSFTESYSPPENTKVKAVNILLLGAVGAGKSSFFNSVNSLYQREIRFPARSGSTERSLTSMYRRYRVRNKDGDTLKVRLCDTRGLESEEGLGLVDLLAVTEGHIPDRFQFNPTIPITSDSPGYIATPTPDNKIHCIAFVVDGTCVDVYPAKILKEIKTLQQRLIAKGVPQVVILTKPDKVCPAVQEDVEAIFYSATIGDLVEKAGQLFGLPRSCVFPLKNYEHEVEVSESIDLPLLVCLGQMIRYADDYIRDIAASD